VPYFKQLPKWWDRQGHSFETAAQIINSYLDYFEPDFLVEAEPGLAGGLGFNSERVLQLSDVLTLEDDYRTGHGLSTLDLYDDLYHKQFHPDARRILGRRQLRSRRHRSTSEQDLEHPDFAVGAAPEAQERNHERHQGRCVARAEFRKARRTGGRRTELEAEVHQVLELELASSFPTGPSSPPTPVKVGRARRGRSFANRTSFRQLNDRFR
jgi:hypothetical protein